MGRPQRVSVARTHLVPIAQRHVAHAHDHTAVVFTRNLVAQLRVVAPQIGPACYALIAPDEDGAGRLASVDLGTLDDADLASLAEAIATSATDPQPIPKVDQLERKLHQIAAVLRKRFGDDLSLLNRLGEPGVDRARACQVMVSFYVAILRTADAPSVGPLFRYVHSKQADKQPIE